MGFNLLTFPQLEIEPSYPSRWSCVHHPIKYTGQRQDAQILNFVSTPSATICVVNAVPADVSIGSVIKWVSLDGLLTGEAEVLNITGTNLILGPQGATFTSGSLLVLSRVGYFLTVKVWGVNDANTWQEVGELELSTDTLGRAEITINALLKKLVSFGDRFQYNQINKRFFEAGSRLAITYREEWQGYTGSFTALNRTSPYFWVNGTKQLGEEYNFNAGYLTTFAAGGPLAKFASEFERPTYFKGYPFSLTFIYSEHLAGRQINRVDQTFDVNGSSLATDTAALATDQNSGVNRLKIKETYLSGADSVDVWLEDAGTELIGYDEGTYSTGGYSETVPEELPIYE